MQPDETDPAPKFHDVTVVTKKNYACAKVEGVPPEEFGISRHAKSIRDAGYLFHDTQKTEADLIDQGYDEEQIKKLPSYSGTSTIEQQARDTVDENTQRQGDQSLNKSARLIRVTEHYLRMDYEGDGKPALYRVTTGGEESEVLVRDGKPDIEKIDVAPFAAMTPVIMTHRFFGRSVADLVMDIQRIKTALLRALLDNAYLANNPRTEVSESHASETTLDDLLVARPRGIVRTKMPGGLNVLQHPDIGGNVFPLLQYQDATREWRTGVSRQGQGTDPNALQNQVATIANQMFNAAQAKTKLIARIFAETGIRDLFSLLHGTVRKNGSQQQTVRLRNSWVTVDPREWKQRNDMSINVGLGTGSKGEQLTHLQLIIGAQTQALQAGLVSKKNLWESAKELTKLAGHKDHNRFFTPPGQPPDPADPDAAPLPMPEDPKMKEMAAKAEIEKLQAQADIATQDRKTQAELAMMQQKHALEMEKLKAELARDREKHQQVMSQAIVKGMTQPQQQDKDGNTTGPHPAEALAPLLTQLMDGIKKAARPKRVVRDGGGRAVGIEHVNEDGTSEVSIVERDRSGRVTGTS